jgi:multisubunit Na+/H+ antiporter MnhE subunit
MKSLAILTLTLNFLRAALISAWDTGRIILLHANSVKGGMVRLPYRGLSPGQANLVGALITLAPGTTTVHIDLEQEEFHLHLLDLTTQEKTGEAIQRDFISPLQRLNGVDP